MPLFEIIQEQVLTHIGAQQAGDRNRQLFCTNRIEDKHDQAIHG